MTDSFRPSWSQRRYFVDEAGDPILFNRHGTETLGRPGCSRYFIMGCIEVDDEPLLASRLNALRAELMADPALKDVPSMQPHRRRTAEAFHANQDHSKVRGRVISLLAQEHFRFFAVIRDKRNVLEDLRATQRLIPSYRYSENALYDSLVGRLLRDRLHVDDCEIVFARRGASDRTAALREAIEEAKTRFQVRWNHTVDTRHTVHAATPKQFGSLQGADYCLWALQRFVERGEDAAWKRLSSRSVEVVLLEPGSGPDGHTFNRLNPLTLKSWSKASGI